MTGKPLPTVKRIIKDNGIEGVQDGTQRLYSEVDFENVALLHPKVRGEELKAFLGYDKSKFDRFIRFMKDWQHTPIIQLSGVLKVLDAHQKGKSYLFDPHLIVKLLELHSVFEEQLNARPQRKKKS